MQAGELIGSGTVGWGCGMEHGKMLKPGDVVELEVEGIGVLRNKMGVPAPTGWIPPRRTRNPIGIDVSRPLPDQQYILTIFITTPFQEETYEQVVLHQRSA